MDEHTLNLLEYERLLRLLAGFAQSEPGREYCLSLRPDLDPEQAGYNWRLINEAKELTNIHGLPPLTELTDIRGPLSRLSVEGSILRPLELLSLYRVIRTSRLVRNFLLSQETVLLRELAEELPVFSEFESALTLSLGPEGEVLDTASAKLAGIRRNLSGLRGSIRDRLTDLMRSAELRDSLQDDIITRRGSRYVIPLKSSLRRSVPGLVHDYSKSGATAYVEPLEMVEDNNRLNLLRRQEKQEVERVLAGLTYMASTKAGEIETSLHLLSRLDGLFAQAVLSRRHRGVEPQLDPSGVRLLEARHPLLLAREAEDGRLTVPLDLIFTEDRRVLVVSGVNAGGKTVALKTLGLLVLMAQTGLHLPVREDSRISFFEHVLASIGDEQDLQSDLSTFSGHVRRLSQILAVVNERSLVLLDELGTGTDPSEGAALALAVLDELKNRGPLVMTATHYHLLKAWARLEEGAGNAAVLTDQKGLPVYGLEYGAPGFSAGLAMARDLGMDPEVVARAESYLDEGQKKTLELMQRLEEERAGLAASRAESEYYTAELAAACLAARKAEEQRTRNYNESLSTLKKQVAGAIAQAEKDFKQIKSESKGRRALDGRLINKYHQVKNELRQAVPALVRPNRPLTRAGPGDLVRVVSLNRNGRVTAVDSERQRVHLDVGGMAVSTTMDDLTSPEAGQEKPRRRTGVYYTPVEQVPFELNILGLTVDEALPVLEKSLDQAVLSGVRNLTIIHGLGTGRLRQAVRGYLAGDARVSDYHRADSRTGGEGVTMVVLDV